MRLGCDKPKPKCHATLDVIVLKPSGETLFFHHGKKLLYVFVYLCKNMTFPTFMDRGYTFLFNSYSAFDTHVSFKVKTPLNVK